MGKNNILIIAAHPDDEVLGVGGTILHHITQKDTINILILADGEHARDHYANIEKRKQQAYKVAKKLGINQLFLENLPDNQLDTIPLLTITKIIEKYNKKIKPNIIYTHHGHDLNIDHQITFQAMLTACRPLPHSSIKSIYTFETPSSTEWQMKETQYMFTPNKYVNISKYIDKKLNILKIYGDELRIYPHPRSLAGIKLLAQYRGMEVGFDYAEAFQIIRSIND